MNRSHTKARRLLLLALLTTTPLATGCSSSGLSMASMNPFSKNDPSSFEAPTSVADAPTDGIKGQLASFGSSAKSAFGKTASVFRLGSKSSQSPEVGDDALSLGNMPEKVDPKVHVANGQLWESTGDAKKAAESYARALASDPNHGPALANLARLNYRQGDYPAAAENFQKALNQSPNDAQLYNELGLTLNKLGRTDMALTVMRRALTIAPGTSRYANTLASVMHESGNPNGAFEVLAKNNKPAVAHFNMAYLQFKSGNVADARRHLNETMKFEADASKDAAVARAIDRSKDMMAQIAALDAGKPNTPGRSNTPGQPGTATTGSVAKQTAPSTKPSAQTRVAAHTTPSAGSHAKPSGNVPFGFGWPGAGGAKPTTVRTASAQVPSSPTAETKKPSSEKVSSLFAMPTTGPKKSSDTPAPKVATASAPAKPQSTTKPASTPGDSQRPSWLDAYEQSESDSKPVAPPKKLQRR